MLHFIPLDMSKVIFVKSIIVQKYLYTLAYDIIKSPEHFEIKNKELRPI